MRKLLVVLLLTAGFVSPVHANTPPTIALIDSGVNTKLYPNNIAYEVCVIENTVCPNGKSFMEGEGSANLTRFNNSAINHGNQMLSVMVKVNPNVRVIPIRIVGQTDAGNPYIYSLAGVKSALDWVVANRAKFNISVVSIATGKIFAGCAVPAGLAESVATLKANNVQIVAATGNDRNRTSVHSPACLSDVISVGATDNPHNKSGVAWDSNAKPTIALYSNGNAQTTLYANARWFVTNLDGTTKFTVGTSNATASIASWLILNKKETWDSTYQNLIVSSSGTASNQWLTGRYLLINS